MSPYHTPDEPSDARLDRLEASVRAGRVERVTSMLKFGLNTLFVLAGISGLALACAFLAEKSATVDAQRAELATAATEEAQAHCADACESHGFVVESVRTSGARATACVCADEERRVVLWNDQPAPPPRTLEEQAYDRCENACGTKGMLHANVVCAHRNPASIGDVCDSYVTRACHCNGQEDYLWDDRP